MIGMQTGSRSRLLDKICQYSYAQMAVNRGETLGSSNCCKRFPTFVDSSHRIRTKDKRIEGGLMKDEKPNVEERLMPEGTPNAKEILMEEQLNEEEILMEEQLNEEEILMEEQLSEEEILMEEQLNEEEILMEEQLNEEEISMVDEELLCYMGMALQQE